MKNLSIICCLVVICLLNIPTLQEDQGDWVDVNELLPGMLVHPFFSGYLNLSISDSEHKKVSKASYSYVYYPSEGNPSKDPLLITISPGPGCSGLYSFMHYKGPFVFITNSTELKGNQFNWNKNANILFIEGPEGVGFSTGDNTTLLNDQTYVQFLYDAILKFYGKFPELRDQALYLTGQNYAGQVIPKLSVEIIKRNRDQSTPAWQKMNLKGLLLTNPCTLGNQCDRHFQFSPYTFQFLKNHYYISRQTYQQYVAKCNIIFFPQQCQQFKQKVMANFRNTGADLGNPYKDCLHQGDKYKCLDYIGIQNFFSHEKAKTLMHADPSIDWQLCNFKITESFERDPYGSYHTYQQLLKSQHNLKIWIVSGILDGNIPTYGTKLWFDQLKLDLNLQTVRLWQPWFYDQDINAGDIESVRGMSLITIRSAGLHMFMDQPELGSYLLKTFLENGQL